MTIYKFTPTEDITVADLAKVFNHVIAAIIQAVNGERPTGKEDLELDDSLYQSLPTELKRFFVAENTVNQD